MGQCSQPPRTAQPAGGSGAAAAVAARPVINDGAVTLCSRSHSDEAMVRPTKSDVVAPTLDAATGGRDGMSAAQAEPAWDTELEFKLAHDRARRDNDYTAIRVMNVHAAQR